MQAAITAPEEGAYFILKARTETRAFFVSIQKATCQAKATGGKPDAE